MTQEERIQKVNEIADEVMKTRTRHSEELLVLEAQFLEVTKDCTHVFADGKTARWSAYDERGCFICDRSFS